MKHKERNEKILELVGNGGTYSEVGAALSISRNAVAGVINRYGIKPPDPAKVKGGCASARPVVIGKAEFRSLSAAAVHFKITAPTVKCRCESSDPAFKSWQFV